MRVCDTIDMEIEALKGQKSNRLDLYALFGDTEFLHPLHKKVNIFIEAHILGLN